MPKAIEYCSRASEVTKAEISEAREVNGTCQSPLRRSNLVTYLAAPTLSTQSSILFEEVLKKMTVLGFQPFLIYPAVINYGTKGTDKLRFPSESGGFYQLPVSAADVCRCSVGGGRRGNSGHCLSGPAGGA